jgi:predicted RNA-binding protein YlqC (UPF0109 family)
MKKILSVDSQKQAANDLAVLIKAALDEIVIYPDALKVHAFSIGGSWDVLEIFIEPDPGDAKRVIGTAGAHIKALRFYVELWGRVHGASVAIRDLACPRDDADKYPKFRENADWPKEKLASIVKGLAEGILEDPVQIETADVPGATHLVVRYTEPQSPPMITTLGRVLTVLVAAMGKKNGRTIIPHVRPENLVAR